MAQITIYVPDDVARRLKREARKAKKSLSAYLIDQAVGQSTGKAWPEWFFELQGSCRGGLTVPDDPPPEEVESL